MADHSKNPSDSEIKPQVKEAPVSGAAQSSKNSGGGDGGGWGGWGFSPLSYFSDLQKAAAVAAEEISRNAVEAAKVAEKIISENVAEDSESSMDEGKDPRAPEEQSDDEDSEKHKAALDKLVNASEESLLSQGLKTLDTSVETFASGAWQALGSAWKGFGNSASTLAGGSPKVAGSASSSIIETGKALTAKSMQIIEQVGKEAVDLLISETGIQVERKSDGSMDGDQLFEETTFDRCFYIYGGPEQLEELEALSNHYALLFNRKKAKLSPEQKSVFEEKLKEIQRIFDLDTEVGANVGESEKGKEIKSGNDNSIDELKKLHDSSIRKAAELAAGFASALAGLSPSDIVQKTSGRLDTLHSEGVHRLSEMCCFAVTQLLTLGKSIISDANKVQDQEIEEEAIKIDWPQDMTERAKLIRTKAQSVTGNMELVFNSFVTGISDVAEAYLAAIKSAATNSQEAVPQKSVQEKAAAFKNRLHIDHSTAVGKVVDGLQYLTYLVVTASMPAA